MWKASFANLILCVASIAFCQQQQMPQKITPTPRSEANLSGEKERIDHLRQAAVHLEAAGLTEESQIIRRMLGSENSPSVMVQISFVEVSLEKMNKLGFDYAKVVPNSPLDATSASPAGSVKQFDSTETVMPNGGFMMLKQDDRYFSVLKAMSKNGLAKTLAAPTIVTQSGREASCHIGGQNFPVSIKSDIKPNELEQLNAAVEKIKNSGTKVEVMPVVLDGQIIHLKVRGSVSELDAKHTTNIAGNSLPGVKTREFNTTCNIKDGHVLVLQGLTTKESALIALIKAEIVNPNQTAMKPPPGLLE